MDISRAPEKGIMYALYEDRVEYHRYRREELPEDIAENLLELHLFDESMEYRFVRTSRGEIEVCVDDHVRHDDIYTEEIYTLNLDTEEPDRKHRIAVVNYITFDENDMMSILNYRLKEVRKS